MIYTCTQNNLFLLKKPVTADKSSFPVSSLKSKKLTIYYPETIITTDAFYQAD